MNGAINQDVIAFKDDFFKGLSLRETLFGLLALIVGTGGIAFFYFYVHLSINLSITICMPIITLIGLAGFYQKNNMTFTQIISHIICLHRQPPLVYASRRGLDVPFDYTEPIPETGTEESDD